MVAIIITGSMSVYNVMPVCHVMSCLCHACVSHLLLGQAHFLECFYRNCLIGTHMCVHPVSERSGFFTLQCELFTSCNVSNNASLVSAQTGGGGWRGGFVINQMWTGLERGREVPKISKFVRTSFMDDPLYCVVFMHKKCTTFASTSKTCF